ncbi:hypothetical protein KI387_028065, partial [Taxus chinensis]
MDNMMDPNLAQASKNDNTWWQSKVERVLNTALKTALLCVEFVKNKRPSMSRAVEMLTTELVETTVDFTQNMAATQDSQELYVN